MGSRQVDLRSIFSKSTAPQETGDHTSALRALSHALEKQLRTWWDISTIEMYLRENLISRGLRWDVAPQDGLDDPTSQGEWLEFFNRCGRELQALILKRKRRKMTLLEEKIKSLQLELEPVKDDKSTKDFNDIIKKKLEKIDRDTQKKKVKKFNRDLKDFTNNQVYNWQIDPEDGEHSRAQQEMETTPVTPRGIPKGKRIQNRKKLVSSTPHIQKPSYDHRGVAPRIQSTPHPPKHEPGQHGNNHTTHDTWKEMRNRGRGRGRGRPYQHHSRTDPPPVRTYNYYQPLDEQVSDSPRRNVFLGRGRGRGRGRHRPPMNRYQEDRDHYREPYPGEEDVELEEDPRGKKRRRV